MLLVTKIDIELHLDTGIGNSFGFKSFKLRVSDIWYCQLKKSKHNSKTQGNNRNKQRMQH